MSRDLDNHFERTIQKSVRERRWSELSGQWINFLPSIEPPGAKPEEVLSDYIESSNIIDGINDKTPTILIPAPGLRQYVFREGIFLFHKASHVISSAEKGIKRGQHTWSLSEAYHGALFCAKSIIYLLGVALPEYKNQTYLIDIWPKEELSAKKGKIDIGPPENSPVQISKLQIRRIEHRHVWQLLQRLLRVSKVDFWPRECLTAFKKLEFKEFAKQRNDIHYKNHYWIFDDLYQAVLDDNFAVYENDISNALIFEERSSFSMALALTVLRFAYLLFENITQNTRKLDSEKSLIQSQITQEHHPLYVRNFAISK